MAIDDLKARARSGDPEALQALRDQGFFEQERPAREGYLLSSAQKRLWLIDQMSGGGKTAYNMPGSLLLHGDLDQAVFVRALGAIVERHESLRTTFLTIEGQPRQKIHSFSRFPVEQVDLRTDPEAEKTARRLAQRHAQEPFDLERGPLFRASLLRLPEEQDGRARHVFLFNLHHIICDEWSIGVIVSELSLLYEAFRMRAPSPLEPLALQYKDFAAQQIQQLRGETVAVHRDYWRRQFDGDWEPLDLTTDFPRPPIQSFEGSSASRRLSQDTSAGLRQLARTFGVSLYVTLLASVKALIHRYTQAEDITVGGPATGRERYELEGQVGFFVNTLGLRDRVVSSDTFGQLIDKVRQTVSAGFEHQMFPFEDLLDELALDRDLSRSPLFDVMVVLNDTGQIPLQLTGIQASVYEPGPEQAKFDLLFEFADAPDGIHLRVIYNRDLYARARMDALTEHLENLMGAAAGNPKAQIRSFDLMSPSERQRLAAWDRTDLRYPSEATVHELFGEQVARTPDAVALKTETESWTYRQLDDEAEAVAASLRARRLRAGELVGLCADRSMRLLSGVIGILKAGGAYVPFDPDYPEDRLLFMMGDTQARLVLTTQDLQPRLLSLIKSVAPEARPQLLCLDRLPDADHQPRAGVAEPPPVAADSLAYCMYTSGSTGRPKGTLIPHRAIVRLVRGTNYMRFDDQVFLLLAPFSFDASTLEIWGPLLNGGTLAIMPPGIPSLEELSNALHGRGVTTLWLTAGLFQLMVDEQLDGLSGLQQLLTGGDVVSVAHALRMTARHPHCRLLNGYGPTENTTFTCVHEIHPDLDPVGSIPIGRPIANTRVYVVDEHLQPVPIGVPGELLAAGDGLAMGYLNQDELTAERFPPNPFTSGTDDRVFRTGDRVRYLPDGSIEFLGRLDEQVKIDGFRIEPAELAAVLQTHDAVREAVAVVRTDPGGSKQLIAAVVGDLNGGDESDLRADLQAHIRGRLPDYMHPAAILVLDQMPLTANGKLDRAALVNPALSLPMSSTYSPSTDSIEAALCSIWAEVLEIDRIGIDDPFLETGGSSIKAIRLVGRILTDLRVKVTVREMFERPTVRQLAGIVRARERTGIGTVEPIADTNDYALSHAQRRLWIIDRMDDSQSAYNIASVTRLDGVLDRQSFERAVGGLIERHESLRTRFVEVDGSPRQIVEAEVEGYFTFVDLTGTPEAERVAMERARAETRRVFDLTQAPLFRVNLLGTTPRSHMLVVNMHHIISDGWSIDLIVRDLLDLYATAHSGAASGLSKLPIQYRDYAHWQSQRLSAPATKHERQFWLDRFADDIPVLDLPMDAPRPAVQSYAGALARFDVPADVTDAIRALGRQHGVSLFVVCVAAVKVLLHRYSRSEDIVIGAPTAGREHPALQDQVGFFVNMLALRDHVSGTDSVAEILDRVRSTVADAMDHAGYPFDLLVEELDLDRNLAHNPLFDVVVSFQDAPKTADVSPEWTLESQPFEPGTSKFDLTFFFDERADGTIGLAIEYATDLFRPDRVDRSGEHLFAVIRGMAGRPATAIGSVPLLGEAERAFVMAAGHVTPTALPDATVTELFEAQVARTPDAPAIRIREEELTYRQLNNVANQLADALNTHGELKPEDPVAILVERSSWLATAPLAILKVGGAYLPLDPSTPVDRQATILREAGCRILLTLGDPHELSASSAHLKVIDLSSLHLDPLALTPDLEPRGSSRSLAYVMFTSGSSGEPKGVEIEQRSVVRLVRNTDYVQLGPVDRILQAGSLAFDASTFELWGALLNGGCLCFADNDADLLDPDRLGAAIRDHNVTTMFVTTSLFNQLVDARPTVFCGLKRVLTGGERASTQLIRRALEASPGLELLNVYGPTENTTFTSWYHVARPPDDDDLPLGGPVANTTILVLDEFMQLCPIGIPGEICTGGAGVARGYREQPDLTRDRFISSPFSSDDKLYRTGDLGEWAADGTLRFRGRTDDQVKVRGYRIEPGEIAHHLREHPDIGTVHVLTRQTSAGTLELLAYYSCGRHVEAAELRAFLGQRLPPFMIPSHFVAVAELPVTRNGKVDERALRRLSVEEALTHEAPRTSMEQTLVDILGSVLGLDHVGLDDGFFELGGDSIRAIQTVSRLRQAALHLQVKDLFHTETIRDLATRIEAGTESPRQERLTGAVPLTPIQTWFLLEHDHDLHHFNQSVLLESSRPLDTSALQQVIAALVEHHDILRASYRQTAQGWRQYVAEDVSVHLEHVDLSRSLDPLSDLESRAAATHASFDLSVAPLIRTVHCKLPDGERLLIVLHHLICDGVTWRILLADIERAYEAAVDGQPITLGPRSTNYGQWSRSLQQFCLSAACLQEARFWTTDDPPPPPIPRDGDSRNVHNIYRQTETVDVVLSEEETRSFLAAPQRAYRADAETVLLTALSRCLCEWHGGDATSILMESHGRQPLSEDHDLTRTVGWFTSLFPFTLHSVGTDDRQAIRSMKESLRSVPRRGLAYGAAKYLSSSPTSGTMAPASLVFNYLGQFDTQERRGDSKGQGNPNFRLAGESMGEPIGPHFSRATDLEVTAIVVSGKLQLSVMYHPGLHHKATIRSLTESCRRHLVQLIAHCDRATSTEKTPTDFTDASLSLAEYDALVTAAKWHPQDIDDVFRLAPMQAGLLYQHLLEPDSAAYFVQMAFTLTGPLQVDSFRAAWDDLVERHAILRTAFVVDSQAEPLQVAFKHRPPDFYQRDLSLLPAATQAARVDQYCERDLRRRFDLQSDPLMRFGLFQLGCDRHRFVWSYHHLLLDGWSLGNLFGEFYALYQGRCQSQPARLPVVRPYSRYIQWLRQLDPDAAQDYWQQRLSGLDRVTSIPRSSRPPSDASDEVAQMSFSLPRQLSGDLAQLARDTGVTSSTLIQTAWALVLSRYNGTSDIVFGAVVSGRPAALDHVEQMVGLFINTIPVRICVDSDQRVVDLLDTVLQEGLQAEAYHHHPLAQIQAMTPLQQGLFDHVFVFENYPPERVINPGTEGGELRIERPVSHDVTHYPFNLVVIPGETMEFRFTYQPGVYSEPLIDRVRTHLCRVLEQIVAKPQCRVGEIGLLTEAEQQQLIMFERSLEPPCARDTVVDLFETQSRLIRDETALIVGGQPVTYGALSCRSNQLARYLRSEHDVDTESRVAILLDRDQWMVESVLGVLKAGAAYLPIDPTEPAERVGFVLDDADVDVALTHSQHLDRFGEDTERRILCLDRLQDEVLTQSDMDLESRPAGEDAAYVIYTSGSTGNPKGCVVEHRNLCNYLSWASAHYFEHSDSGHFGLFSPLSFDLTVTSLFLPLIRGNSLTIYPADSDLRDIFQDMFTGSRIDAIKLTPSHIALLREFGLSGPISIDVAIVGGEALLPDHVELLHQLQPDMRVFNEYGPTETTVGCVTAEVPAGASHVPIGRPIAGTSIRITDQIGRRVPIGVAGEIRIGGAGVSRGYLNRASLTDECFVPSGSHADEKVYRSGDLGRWDEDGTLEYLGRSDEQVKVRGFRIEPGEIEQCMLSHPEIAQATIVATSAGELTAYLVGGVDTTALRPWLLDRLPAHMIPSWFVCLDVIPLTRNGKLDRSALPHPVAPTSTGHRQRPRDEIESHLARIWETVMQNGEPGIFDDFFAQGGHSLKATQIVSRIMLEMDVRLSLRTFFDEPTIAALADRIRSGQQDRLERIRPAAEKPTYELSHAQRRLWLVHQLAATGAYNIPQAYWIRGKVDHRRLAEALQRLVERHEILRTAFIDVDGEPRQQILDTVSLEIDKFEVSGEADAISAARQLVETQALEPFDLSRPPLVRAQLIETSRDEVIFALTLHHIVADGWSQNILFRELMQLYGGDLLPELSIQYKDFSEWQNHQAFDRQQDYWLSRLAEPPELVPLPYDTAPEQDRDFGGAVVSGEIEGETLHGLREMAREKQVTLANFVLSLFKLFLFRLTRQEDLWVGVSIANRNHPDLEHLIGFFVNVLPIRTRITSEMTFDDLLEDVSGTTLEAYDHQDYPFDLMIEKTNPDRLANRQPLLNVVYAFQNYADTVIQGDGTPGHADEVRIEPFEFSLRTSKFDLTLFAFDDTDRLVLHMEYDTSLFRTETVERYLETLIRFATMLSNGSPTKEEQ